MENRHSFTWSFGVWFCFNAQHRVRLLHTFRLAKDCTETVCQWEDGGGLPPTASSDAEFLNKISRFFVFQDNELPKGPQRGVAFTRGSPQRQGNTEVFFFPVNWLKCQAHGKPLIGHESRMPFKPLMSVGSRVCQRHNSRCGLLTAGEVLVTWNSRSVSVSPAAWWCSRTLF